METCEAAGSVINLYWFKFYEKTIKFYEKQLKFLRKSN